MRGGRHMSIWIMTPGWRDGSRSLHKYHWAVLGVSRTFVGTDKQGLCFFFREECRLWHHKIHFRGITALSNSNDRFSNVRQIDSEVSRPHVPLRLYPNFCSIQNEEKTQKNTHRSFPLIHNVYHEIVKLCLTLLSSHKTDVLFSECVVLSVERLTGNPVSSTMQGPHLSQSTLNA